MSEPKAKLSFGIEIELYIKPNAETMKKLMSREKFTYPLTEPKQQGANRLAVFDFVEEQLKEWLSNCVTTRDGQPIKKFSEWSVDEDSSLEDEKEDVWGIELVSRILSTRMDWESEVKTLFTRLQQHWEIQEPQGCATHIHVSPFDSGFTLPQVKKIMKATWLFNDAFTKTATTRKKYDDWCMPNHQVYIPDELPPEDASDWNSFERIIQAYEEIENREGTSWEPIFKEIDGTASKRAAYIRMGGERQVSMNFSHLFDKQDFGTIEFRRPPGITNSEDAIYYTLFALGFFAEALEVEERNFNNSYQKRSNFPSVKEFNQFVEDGLRRLDGRTRDTDRVYVLTRRPLKEHS
ncbi:putative amidoligase [Xylariaceae sp. FL1019]|nr:putative amidoligase [Xylariaceae sp. FL1019]